MTAEEQKQERDAEILALACGGVLAVLLGLKPSDTPVVFDVATGYFMIGTERVAAVTIRDSLARLQSHVGARMVKLAAQLFSGAIVFDAWRSGTMELITSAHIIAAALAAGSIEAAMTLDRLGQRIGEQKRYAAGLGKAVDEKKPGMTVQRVKARATSYVAAIGVTFAVIEQDLRKSLGISQYAYRTVHASESCDGCQVWAGVWIPIEEMPEIGSLECSVWCRCTMDYS